VVFAKLSVPVTNLLNGSSGISVVSRVLPFSKKGVRGDFLNKDNLKKSSPFEKGS
jgi:hypothetical protein